MDKKSALEILARFKKALESQQVKLDKLILFGSKDFAGKDFWQRTDILSEAIYEVFEPIEAVALTPEEWEKGESVVVEYAKNGEVVYG